MYLTEKLIIGSVWLISFISVWFIPRQKYREASFIFMFTQLPAWIFGLLVVELGLIEYPVRELSKANATSFSFEYLVLPFICIFFNLYFPESKGFYKKLAYYTAFLSVFTFIEFIVEKNTLILRYIHWEWYTTLISMGILIYFVRAAYKWFFNMTKSFDSK